ncbi:MAG: DUF4124 domain-containing protein [Methylophilaceae bacterium]|nr:DUF4124 domain-containing protein [Methyloradius sp.]
MKKSLSALSVLITACICIPSAYADIYSCVDDKGQTAFADSKNKIAYKNCKLIMRDDSSPVASSSMSSGGTKTATPSNFPRIDKKTQSQRDDKRKDILQTELDTEKKALADVQKSYDQDNKNAEFVRANNIKEPAKIAQFEDNLKRQQDEINTHQQNIKLLQKELNSIQ